MGPEKVIVEEPGGTLSYRFHARDAHLVLSRDTSEPIPFRLSLDGKPPRASHGVDVEADGTGLLADGRLYQLVRQDGDVGKCTVEITFEAPGAEAYAFTFG